MTRARWNAILTALLLALSVFAAVPASAATSAAAAPMIDTDCKSAPRPASPVGNPLAPGRPYNASAGDPFAKDSDVTIAQVYGNGYEYFTYDNGCKPGSDVMPKFISGTAGLIGLEFPSTWVSWGRLFQTSVLSPDSWIGKIDPAVEQATKSVAEGFWFPWLPVAGLVVAALALVRSRTGQLANVITGLGWSFVVLVTLTWVVEYPTEAPQLVDDGIAVAATSIATGFSGTDVEPPPLTQEDEKRIVNGDTPKPDSSTIAVSAMESQWDEVDRQTSYRTWLTGTFGSADSATARTYGPSAFKATHFSWTEQETYSEDPEGEGKKLLESKAKDFEKVADKVKDADPIAYEHFTGSRYWDRLGTSITGAVVAAITIFFLLVASFGMAAAYVVIRLVVPFAPAAGPIFMIDAFRNLVLDKLKRVAALILMGPIYLVTGLVVLRFNSAVLGSSMSVVFKVFLLALAGWIAWKLVKPLAFGGQSFGMGRMIRQAAATAAGVRVGRGAKDDEKDGEGDQPSGHRTREGDRSDAPDRPVAEPRELRASPVRGALAAAPTDLGEVESMPVSSSRGTFVPRSQSTPDLPSRREALALTAGPVDQQGRTARTLEDDEQLPNQHARPFLTESPLAREEYSEYDTLPALRDSASALPAREESLDEAGTALPDGGALVGQARQVDAEPSVTEPPSTTEPARTEPSTTEPSSAEKGQPADATAQVARGSEQAVSGRLMDAAESVPEEAHEANYTVDEQGQPVFTVYRPETMRRTTDG